MSDLPSAAAALAAAELSPASSELLALHLVDTVAAGLAGAAARTNGPALPLGSDPLARIGAMVALIRSTEIDDIHLASCVTPGSVVVPVALGLVQAGLADGRSLGPALVAGYGAMVGFGLSFGGPAQLYRGIWPTLAVAPLGAAVTAARALGLDTDTTLAALNIAASFIAPRAGHPADGIPARFLFAGEAARLGVTAALAARDGYRGDPHPLESAWLTEMLGRAPDYRVVAELARRGDVLDSISFKPFCAAKQTIAALAAFRAILASGVAPERIEAVEVHVPDAYRGMIAGRLKGDDDRLGTITDVAYQLALAAYHPERLLDLARVPAATDGAAAQLAAKIVVMADPALNVAYPANWPARVRVRAGGDWHERLVTQAPGDPGSNFAAADLAGKLDALAKANGATGLADLPAQARAALLNSAAALGLAERLFLPVNGNMPGQDRRQA